MFCLLIFNSAYFTGCDQAFQPLKENDQYSFSIYGFLDASTDTQWVRVGPPREQINMTAQKPEVTVTLEEMESGETTVMIDSLFLQANGFHYLNFWTTMEIRPGHTYRLSATGPEGESSHVTATTPQDFPTPRLRYYDNECYATLLVSGVQQLADVQSVWEVWLQGSDWSDKRVRRFPYRQGIKNTAPGNYRVLLFVGEEWGNLILPDAKVQVLDRYIFVAAAGPEWNNEIASLTNIEYALPEGQSNVKNGLGYLVGIVSKKVPYEECLP